MLLESFREGNIEAALIESFHRIDEMLNKTVSTGHFLSFTLLLLLLLRILSVCLSVCLSLSLSLSFFFLSLCLSLSLSHTRAHRHIVTLY
jgi:hypothetical protein